MLPGGSAARIYLYASAVDMRRSFDGLHAIVQSEFDRAVRAGDLFVFLNKRRDRMKALWWDTDGLAIFMKRLERGTYQRPNHREGQHLLMDRTQLGLLLSGIELASVRRRRRYISPQVVASTSTTEISNSVVS
jgi:transposase